MIVNAPRSCCRWHGAGRIGIRSPRRRRPPRYGHACLPRVPTTSALAPLLSRASAGPGASSTVSPLTTTEGSRSSARRVASETMASAASWMRHSGTTKPEPPAAGITCYALTTWRGTSHRAACLTANSTARVAQTVRRRPRRFEGRLRLWQPAHSVPLQPPRGLGDFSSIVLARRPLA
jgi:hypothetical protein